MEPEFCFRVGDEAYVDAARVTHWTKRMNHNANAPSVRFDVDEDRRAVSFYAARNVAPNEELCFDYGREFWDGRGVRPLNDDRAYGPASDATCASVELGVPVSRAALRDVLWAVRASRADKRAAVLRGLEYFGVSSRDDALLVDVAACDDDDDDGGPAQRRRRRFFFGLSSRRRKKKKKPAVTVEEATLRELARALRQRMDEADRLADEEELDDP